MSSKHRLTIAREIRKRFTKNVIVNMNLRVNWWI